MITIDKNHDKPVYVLCDWCKHRIDEKTCKAFPKGIPEDILMSRHDHRNPYPGDNGIMFEQEDK